MANHTWDHRYPRAVPGGWTRRYLNRTLSRTSAAITAVTGQPVCWFRPPGGFRPRSVLPAASRLGMTSVLWSVDPQDWKVQQNAATGAELRRQAAAIFDGATAAAGQLQHPIVLLHDGGGHRLATVKALPRIIDWYRERGYTFVRLDGTR